MNDQELQAWIVEKEEEVTLLEGRLERCLAEIRRRSKACTDAAAGNWGGMSLNRPHPPIEPEGP